MRSRYEKYLPPLQQSCWTESDTFSYDPERFDLAYEAEWPDELDLYRVMAEAEPAGRPGRTGAGAGAGAKSRKEMAGAAYAALERSRWAAGAWAPSRTCMD